MVERRQRRRLDLPDQAHPTLQTMRRDRVAQRIRGAPDRDRGCRPATRSQSRSANPASASTRIEVALPRRDRGRRRSCGSAARTWRHGRRIRAGHGHGDRSPRALEQLDQRRRGAWRWSRSSRGRSQRRPLAGGKRRRLRSRRARSPGKADDAPAPRDHAGAASRAASSGIAPSARPSTSSVRAVRAGRRRPRPPRQIAGGRERKAGRQAQPLDLPAASLQLERQPPVVEDSRRSAIPGRPDRPDQRSALKPPPRRRPRRYGSPTG